MGFSRQEYWSGLPFPFPGDLLNPGIEPRSHTLQADFFYHLSHQGSPYSAAAGLKCPESDNSPKSQASGTTIFVYIALHVQSTCPSSTLLSRTKALWAGLTTMAGVTQPSRQMRHLRPTEWKCLVPGHNSKWGQGWQDCLVSGCPHSPSFTNFVFLSWLKLNHTWRNGFLGSAAFNDHPQPLRN